LMNSSTCSWLAATITGPRARSLAVMAVAITGTAVCEFFDDNGLGGVIESRATHVFGD
jgi:type IV secretory pathway VirB2 component (pilin)